MDQFQGLPTERQEALLSSPALEVPDGVTQNLQNPPNNNELGHGVTALCIIIGVLCFFIRIYARVFRLRKLHIEDGLMIFAFGFFVAYVGDLYHLMSTIGIFVHQWDIFYRDLIDIQFILHIGGTFYSITLSCLKAAILLDWSRLFVAPGARNAFWWTCNVLAAMQIVFLISTVIALQAGCRPIERNWDFTVVGSCFEKSKLELATASINLAYDVVILLLPQMIIWQLSMPLKQKLGVALIVSIGVLACISAVFRLVVTVTYTNSQDVTYNVAPLALWALVESTCGFLIFCLPSAPEAFADKGVFPRFKARLVALTGKATSMKSTRKADRGPSSYNTASGPGSRDDDGFSMDDNAIAMSKIRASESTEELRPSETKNGTIVCTTRFTASEDYVDPKKETGNFSRQHPWSNGQSRRDMV